MAHAKSTDPNAFILPDLGEGVHEAELIAWRVQVGQSVEEHEILAEMETDKALVEVPSPRAGVIAALHGSPGEILKVGNPLVSYQGDDNGDGEADAATGSAPGSRTERPTPSDRPGGDSPEPGADRSEDDGTVVGAVPGAAAGVSAAPGKVLATPAVRRLARDIGIDISTIRGSGIGGRVTEKDVRAVAGGTGVRAVAGGAPSGTGVSPVAAPTSGTGVSPVMERAPAGRGASPVAPAHVPVPSTSPPAPAQALHIPPGAETARIPFRGVRRKIAQRLRTSVDTAVHFTVMDEADVTDLNALRRRLASASGEKVSFLPFVASAVCRALTGGYGAMNATVDEERDEIIQHRAVHMGIATDTDTGLMVPVVRDCDALGVLQIAREVARVAAAARDRTIAREQLTGSTFTITNVGSHAGRFATPILNHPEVGILGVGRAREAMVVSGGWFRVGTVLPLSIACDHRVVDGATAAMCLSRIIQLLQEPEQLLEPARE